MKRLLVSLVVVSTLVMAGCGSATPAPTAAPPAPTKAAEPTKAPAPTKAAEPTKAVEPTKAAAPAPAQPTAAPAAKKVDFPEKGKTITMINPLAAGGATDVTFRMLAERAEKELGVPIQVVNKPGGGHQVGLTEMVKSKPDGYTMGIVVFPAALTTYLDPERKSVYGRKDFQPLVHFWGDIEVLGVSPNSPYKTAKDLFDAAKANPGQIKGGTGGIMSTPHLDFLLIDKVVGAKFTVVHFDGGAPAATAFLGGHVDLFLGAGAQASQMYKAGQIRVVGILDKQGSSFFPGIPTMESQGYKLHSGLRQGIAVPAGTPKEIVDVLSAAMKKSMEDEALKAKMREMLLEISYLSPTQYTELWNEWETRVQPLIDMAKQQGK